MRATLHSTTSTSTPKKLVSGDFFFSPASVKLLMGARVVNPATRSRKTSGLTVLAGPAAAAYETGHLAAHVCFPSAAAASVCQNRAFVVDAKHNFTSRGALFQSTAVYSRIYGDKKCRDGISLTLDSYDDSAAATANG